MTLARGQARGQTRTPTAHEMALPVLGVLVMAFLSSSESSVRPRKFSLFVDMFKTWDSARQLCYEVNMTLATLDTQANQFLRSLTSTQPFKKNVKEHFWIGLHESGLSAGYSDEPGYRWARSCAPLTTEAAWDQQEPPGAGSTKMCVYARNETMKWRTDLCNTSHSFICERQTDFCFFNQTDFKACASSFKNPPKAFTVTSDDECMELCEGLVLDGLTCWGFERTTSQCLLYHDVLQPQCNVSGPSSMHFKTCFQAFYIHGSAKDFPTSGRTADSLCGITTQAGAGDHVGKSATTTSPTTVNSFTKPKEPATSSHTPGEITSLEAGETTLGHDAVPELDPTPKVTSPQTEKPTTTSSTHTTTTTTTPATTTSTTPTTPTTTTTITTTPTTTTATTTAVAAAAASAAVVQEGHLPSTIKLSVDRPLCSCRCFTRAVPHVDVTSLLQAAGATQRSLAVRKESLSATRRKRMSAIDSRPSAQRIGWVGISFVVTAAIFVVLMDLANVLRCFCSGETRVRPRMTLAASSSARDPLGAAVASVITVDHKGSESSC